VGGEGRDRCLVGRDIALQEGRYRVPFKWGVLNFSSDLIRVSIFSNRRVHSASNRNEYQKISLVVNFCWSQDLATAVIVVEVKAEAQISVHPLSLRDQLREDFTL
jgi:hypothetical protein